MKECEEGGDLGSAIAVARSATGLGPHRASRAGCFWRSAWCAARGAWSVC